MSNLELENLYARIEADIDRLEVGNTQRYETPNFTDDELLTIPKIATYLKDNKYGKTIRVESFSLVTKVTKLAKLQAKEVSVFENAVFEKSEEEVKAEKAYSACLSGNHDLIETKTTFNNPLLVCKQCKLGYTFKLKSGTRKVANVIQVAI